MGKTLKVKAIACDGEFSNFDKLGGELITFAMVEILEDLTLGRRECWSFKCTSQKYWSSQAEEIHGISYWRASGFPPVRESLLSLMRWLAVLKDQFRLKLVYHGNAKLDPEWLRMTFFKEDLETSYHKAFDEEPISTLKLARENLAHIPESKVINPMTGKPFTKFSLRNVSDFYGIELDHHQALSDAIACAEIYIKILKEEETFTGRLF